MATCMLLLVLASLGTGCGSTSKTVASTSAQATGTLSKDAFASRAGAILRPVGSKLAKLRIEMTRAGTPAQARTEASRVRHLATAAQRALAGLQPPPEIAVEHRALIAELGAVAAQAGALSKVASKPPLAAFLSKAAVFENAPVFRRLGATIARLQARGYDLGLGQTSSS